MKITLHFLDEQGHFEQLESEHLHLYSHINLETDKAKLLELTDEQAEELAKLTGVIRFVDGQFIVETQAVEIDLNSAKQIALNQLANKVDSLKSALMAGYPQAEIDSFYRQEFEARAYLNGDESNIAMIANIAKLRGVPLAVLAEKVVQKADFIAGVIGQVLGVKQKFENAIEQAETLENLASIESEIEKWSI